MRDEQGLPLAETDMADLVTFMETDVCSCFLGSTYAVVQKNLMSPMDRCVVRAYGGRKMFAKTFDHSV